jgi:serine/threonine-protein kinase
MELVPGVVVAERFRLMRPLGQGGMGAVWLATHTGLDVLCALKFIHEESAKSAQVRARFEREAKAAAQLRSPHVVQILDHGVWEGAPYIAMEFLAGEDLAQRLHRLGILSGRETLTIALQVGRALTKAHAAGLIHRDLKPGNIFLARDDEGEIAKVLDFGVAKVKESGLDDANTKTGAVLGTPFYMSPEQARGIKEIDHRSDLWALAVVIYQCLLGSLPFRGQTLADLFMKIIVEPLPLPSHQAEALGVALPPSFDAWWLRAVARDPGERFPSAKELTDALGVALGLSADSASPSSATDPGKGPSTAVWQAHPTTPFPGGPVTPYPGGPVTPYAASQALRGAPLASQASGTPPTLGLPREAMSQSAAPLAVQNELSASPVRSSRRGAAAGFAVLGIAVGAIATVAVVRSGSRNADAPSVATTAPPPIVSGGSEATPAHEPTQEPRVTPPAVSAPSASAPAATQALREAPLATPSSQAASPTAQPAGPAPSATARTRPTSRGTAKPPAGAAPAPANGDFGF